MTDLTRKPKPMTRKDIVQYQELEASLTAQAELIMTVFNNPFSDDREQITKVEFEMGRPDEPWIYIWYRNSHWNEDGDEYFACPERYLGMTEDELKAEKKRLKEEEERKRAEKAAKAKVSREKRKAEREAVKKVKEKEERYKKYLELKEEFEGDE